MTRQEVVTLMMASRSLDEWAFNTQTVKDAFNGVLPDFWDEEFTLSDRSSQLIEKFNRASGVPLPPDSCPRPIGQKATVMNPDSLRPLFTHVDFDALNGQPITFPSGLARGETVIAGFGEGGQEVLFVCEGLEAMQGISNFVDTVGSVDLHWYAGKEELLVPPKKQ